ncbi:MAG TPA: DUF2059 domain-containing protein [Pararhizobium sp.]|nr:DUF2059 domain-containing protein [Pararhizobium sp.]
MTRIFGPGRIAAAFVVAAALGLSSAASAQEPTKAQLDAARAAIAALHATDEFDNILPNAAAALKHSLIQAEPNLQEQITATVNDQALKLATRRADLEKEVATIYAKHFTTDELKAIAAFYNTKAGKKLIDQAPAVTRETMQAARIWSNGIARDLGSATHDALEAKLAKKNGDKAAKTDAGAPKADAGSK